MDKLKNILQALEEGKGLKKLFKELPRTGLAIRIGGENRYEGINECSIVTATYEVDGDILGTLGIIGPTRMNYARAVSLVECVTAILSEVLQKYFRL